MQVVLALASLLLAAPKPTGPSILAEFCKDAAKSARVSAFTPPLGLGPGICGYGTSVLAELKIGKHAVAVVGVEDLSPTATDRPPRRSAQVAVDGKWLTARETEGGSTYLPQILALGRVAARDVAAYLQAVLLAERAAFPQAVSADEQAAIVAGWPAAAKAIADAPAGLLADGRTLRVWEERVDAGLAGACRVLYRHELTLTAAGKIEFAPVVRYAEGTLMNKRSCGDALPR